MKNHISVVLLLITFAWLNACQSQTKPEPKKPERNIETTLPAHLLEDKDHYFTGTYDTLSSYGPRNITRNVLQDQRGDIWLATWEGIIKYDGLNFINYTNKNGLRRYRAFTFLEDSQQNIWFGTQGAGLYFYDGKTFKNYSSKDGLVNDKIGCIYEDKQGKIWIGTFSGISVFDGKTFKNYTKDDGLSNDDINSIVEDDDGNVWIGTRGQLMQFDGELFNPVFNQGNTFQNVRSVMKDKQGQIWFGGNDGLWIHDNGAFKNLEENFTGYIYEDSKGNVWTSSEVYKNAGEWQLSKYEMLKTPIQEMVKTSIKTEENMYFGIIEDNKGDIWVGNLRGVMRYDGESFESFQN